jgi:phosphatidylserine/phosphatidylglycerophosphate/cardiolipin synthase-like enzyme
MVIAGFLLELACNHPIRAESPEVLISPVAIQVYFSPNGGAAQAIIGTIDAARSSVHVEAYRLTSRPIIDALLAAHARDVSVWVSVDRQERVTPGTAVYRLVEAGIPVTVERRHHLAHNKVMIVDERIVITGSYNFTANAETRNAENLLIIASPELARRYLGRVGE